MSIIVPVYNVERWLGACLDSVSSQSLSDWECIVVIDGSPDRSEQIAREYEMRDGRFRVVSVPNGGLGAARNTGLTYAAGEWVFFLDSDDELPCDALNALHDAAFSSGADIVAGVGIDFYPDGRELPYWTQRDVLFSSRGTNLSVSENPQVLFDHVAWNKLYRRSLLDAHQLSFSVGVHCEDMLFAARAAVAARSIAVIPTIVYRHRRHDAAISADYLREKTLRDWVGESLRTIDYLRSSTPDHAVHAYIENFIKRQWWTRVRDLGRVDDRELVEAVENLTAVLWETTTPSLRANLPTLHGVFLDFMAAGLLQQRWGDGTRLRSPLSSDEAEARDLVDAVVTGVAALDLHNEVEARMAVSLIVDWACRQLARRDVAVDDLVDSRQRLSELADRLPTHLFRALVSDVSLDDASGGSDVVTRVLARREVVDPQLTDVALSRTHVTLRGRLRLSLRDPEVRSLSIVMRSMTTQRVRVYPVWWRSGGRHNELTWSVPVALAPDVIDQHWKCWLRIERPGTPPRDVLLRNVMPDAMLDSLAARHDAAGLEHRLFFPRSAAAVWCARQAVGSGLARVPSAAHVAPQPNGVFTFPDWKSNPYLTMLHMEALASGRSMRGSTHVADLLEELKQRSRDIVHIHWTSPIVETADSESAAFANVNAVVSAVRTAVAAGRQVIWTVHNAIPHDSRYPAVARALNVGLAAEVSVVHALSTSSLEAMESQFSIDHDKIAYIAHSSYYGVYGARVPKADARERVKAEATVPTALFFGQIRPYKGVEHLIDAFELIQSDAMPMQLLMAGKVAPEAASIVDKVDDLRVPVVTAFDFIPDDDVSTWFSAADVVVLPYRDILNSGTLMLAATFGVPCIVPGLQHLEDQYRDQAWVSFFGPEQPAESIAALLRERAFLNPEAQESALSFARRFTPMDMARQYAMLLDRLDAPAPDTGAVARRGTSQR